jgi:hypothetical protein
MEMQYVGEEEWMKSVEGKDGRVILKSEWRNIRGSKSLSEREREISRGI